MAQAFVHESRDFEARGPQLRVRKGGSGRRVRERSDMIGAQMRDVDLIDLVGLVSGCAEVRQKLSGAAKRGHAVELPSGADIDQDAVGLRPDQESAVGHAHRVGEPRRAQSPIDLLGGCRRKDRPGRPGDGAVVERHDLDVTNRNPDVSRLRFGGPCHRTRWRGAARTRQDQRDSGNDDSHRESLQTVGMARLEQPRFVPRCVRAGA